MALAHAGHVILASENYVSNNVAWLITGSQVIRGGSSHTPLSFHSFKLFIISHGVSLDLSLAIFFSIFSPCLSRG